MLRRLQSTPLHTVASTKLKFTTKVRTTTAPLLANSSRLNLYALYSTASSTPNQQQDNPSGNANNNKNNRPSSPEEIEELLRRDFPQFMAAKKGSTPVAPEIKLSTVRLLQDHMVIIPNFNTL